MDIIKVEEFLDLEYSELKAILSSEEQIYQKNEMYIKQ